MIVPTRAQANPTSAATRTDLAETLTDHATHLGQALKAVEQQEHDR